MNRALVNLVAFQACWLAAVLGAAAGMPWLGPLFAALWLPLHIRATGAFMAVETKLILAAGVLGYVLDSIIVLSGGMSFPPQAQLGVPTTLWMVTLWLGFAATLRHVLGWIRGHYILAALLGAIAGPFAYWSGSKLGAVVLTDTVPSLLVVGVEWMVAMPLLLLLVSRLERDERTSTQAACQEVW
jgi:hypothetical protein